MMGIVFGVAMIPKIEARRIVVIESVLTMYMLANDLLFVNPKNTNSNKCRYVKHVNVC
jgi:hypothetical protein